MASLMPTDGTLPPGGIIIANGAMPQSEDSAGDRMPTPITKDEDANEPIPQLKHLAASAVAPYPVSQPLPLPEDLIPAPSASQSSTPVDRQAVSPFTTTAKESLLPSGSPREQSRPKISFEEYLALSELTFEWSDSYDDKDWQRLEAILAPTLMVDYTEVNGHRWEAMSASEFVGIMSNVGFVGDPLVHTQHHIGASKWEKVDDDFVIGHHQLRAAHQRYTGMDRMTVENKGHGHATIKHFYRRIGDGDGGKVWKFAGLKPRVRWNEFAFEKIFKGF